jgi:ribose/xylose/arabinose/galactoside ABC-type transport system permease subunit
MSSFFTWQWISAGLPSALAAVVVGLVSAWTGMSRQHWVVRAAVLTGVLSLTLLSPHYPYEYALAHLFQAVCVVAAVTFSRRRTARSDPAKSPVWPRRRTDGNGRRP